MGSITSDELAKKLVKSRKLMDVVDSGNYERGNINEEILRSDPEDLMKIETPTPQFKRNDTSPSIEKINQTKLPDAIKRAMIENPIPQISLNDTIDMDFIKKAKNLMEKEGDIKRPTQQPSTIHTNEIVKALTPIIENIIRKTLDEKLNQILSAQQTMSINENLVLKVGDSIFKGKITGVNKSS
jgi:hypothetical protein